MDVFGYQMNVEFLQINYVFLEVKTIFILSNVMKISPISQCVARANLLIVSSHEEKFA